MILSAKKLVLYIRIVWLTGIFCRPIIDTLPSEPLPLNVRNITRAKRSLGPRKFTKQHQIEFLKRYGYYNEPEPFIGAPLEAKDPNITEALLAFQMIYGLNTTGTATDETVQLMRRPRCGVPDGVSSFESAHKRRSKRYVVNNRGWKDREILSYKINNYNNDGLSEGWQNWALRETFDKYSKVSYLKFYRYPDGDVDMDLWFKKFKHDDPWPFDGPGGILAHAFGPGLGRGGDVHLDESENWSQFHKLTKIWGHEIGHALGFGHSSKVGSLMNPYPNYGGKWFFSQDDIAGIHDVYGPPGAAPKTTTKRTTTTTTTTPAPTTTTTVSTTTPFPRPKSNIKCFSRKFFDAITTDAEENTYIFKKNFLFKYNKDGKLLHGFPKQVNVLFPALPCPIDSIVFVPELVAKICKKIPGRDIDTFCFKKRPVVRRPKYFVIRKRKLFEAEGSDLETSAFTSRPLSYLHSGIIGGSDYVLFSTINSSVSIIRDDRLQHVELVGRNDALPILDLYSVYPDLPRDKKIDAAMTSFKNGYTYFFTRDEYIPVNGRTNKAMRPGNVQKLFPELLKY